MTTTQSAIVLLTVLDMLILLFVYRFDRRHYRKPLTQQIHTRHFFCNPAYDDQVNRLLLSKGGLLLCTILFTLIFILQSLHGFN
ncbi:hypothetical protein [Mucilaginibacter paludis]|uniref:hypothetical protein n=1 Tax=Mucilaginibacter paludis TaxID=423351 RepID=UPI00058EF2C6|nr:hypothetical protein [Mucilaginibacter paludis]